MIDVCNSPKHITSGILKLSIRDPPPQKKDQSHPSHSYATQPRSNAPLKSYTYLGNLKHKLRIQTQQKDTIYTLLNPNQPQSPNPP